MYLFMLLYENNDQILPNTLHGPMHYTIGVACIYNGHVFYSRIKFYVIYSVVIYMTV